MVKPTKLYNQLLQSTDRTVSFRDFVTLAQSFGFVHARTRGSHQSFGHRACPRLLLIQPLGKDTKRYQVREFLDMIEEYGLTLEE